MSDEPRRDTPRLEFETRFATTDSIEIPGRVQEALVQAIEQKQFVTLEFALESVFGEPHVYDIVDGSPAVLLYDAEAAPPWRVIHVGTISHVTTWHQMHFAKRELPAEYNPGRHS